MTLGHLEGVRGQSWTKGPVDSSSMTWHDRCYSHSPLGYLDSDSPDSLASRRLLLLRAKYSVCSGAFLCGETDKGNHGAEKWPNRTTYLA